MPGRDIHLRGCLIKRLLDIQRNLHRLVGKTCAGAGISRPRDPGGLIETYPDLGQTGTYGQFTGLCIHWLWLVCRDQQCSVCGRSRAKKEAIMLLLSSAP